tara:strand:+ start:487 stop:702 length:216 start_codon:yes stop_codon:yes gene_type:complete
VLSKNNFRFYEDEMSMLYDKVCEAEEHQNAQTHMYILNEDSITVLHSSDKEITKKEMRPFIDQISAAKELS